MPQSSEDLIAQMAQDITKMREDAENDATSLPTDSVQAPNTTEEPDAGEQAPEEVTPGTVNVPDEGEPEEDEETEDEEELEPEEAELAEPEEEEEEQEPEPAVAPTAQAELPPEVKSLVEWQQSLTPDQINAINLLMSGKFQLVPVQQTPTTPEPQVQATQIQEDEFIDPAAAKHIQRLESELAEFRQSQQAQVEQERQRQVAALQSQMDQGQSAFKESKQLSEEDMSYLIDRVGESGIFPGVFASVQRETGMANGALAIQRSLEMIYRADDKYQQRELQSQLDQERSETVQRKQKKKKSSALSAKGGSVSREPAPPSNTQERHDAMVAEIASFQQQT